MNTKNLTDETIVSALRAESTQIDAPEHVIQRAFGIWSPKAVAKPSFAARILATLKFDSAAVSPIAMGVRSVSMASRQMLFSAEGRDIDVRLAPEKKSGQAAWSISGQVLGPDDNGSVSLLGERREWSSELNELSEFFIEDVPAGEYQLTFMLNGSMIVLPQIQVGTN
jgi:hypothetical protein